jgi:DNA-binding HxlR family transcriptional regulator
MQVTKDQELESPRTRPARDSVEATLAQVGDTWTFLILRDAFFGVRRFDAFQRSLNAAPNIVAGRLKKLVGFGILARRQYNARPPRDEYVLTEKGRDLYPAIVLLMRWGDRWANEESEPPLRLIHKPCGRHTRPTLVCDQCSDPIAVRDMDWEAIEVSPL